MISFAPKCRADDRVKHLSVSARVTEHTERDLPFAGYKSRKGERLDSRILRVAIGIGK